MIADNDSWLIFVFALEVAKESNSFLNSNDEKQYFLYK